MSKDDPSKDEHPNAFSEALARVEDLIRDRRESRLTLDLWGPPPCVATVFVEGRSFTGIGETPAAALRALAERLTTLLPSSGDDMTRPIDLS